MAAQGGGNATKPEDPVHPLPDYTIAFTLPSLHDGLLLDCRLYHPESLDPTTLEHPAAQPAVPEHWGPHTWARRSWRKHAAIVAPPYAPMEGSYNDRVVNIVGNALLKLGYLVMTFNFRGAPNSAGKTSWTAKAERADYMSVIGFLSYYVHFLDPFREFGDSRSLRPPVLIMAGYSYGSMITTQLPSLLTILAKFDKPPKDSYAAGIRLLAQYYAERENTQLATIRRGIRESLRTATFCKQSRSLRAGGVEVPLKSLDKYKAEFEDETEDTIKQRVAQLKEREVADSSKRANERIKQAHSNEEPVMLGEGECLQHIEHRIPAMPAYLLISPLRGVIRNLLTMSFSFMAASSLASWKRYAKQPSDEPHQPGYSPGTILEEAERKLWLNHTFIIFGDRDRFVSVRELGKWAHPLEKENLDGSKLTTWRVHGADHLWSLPEHARDLRDLVRGWAAKVLGESLSGAQTQ